jgi:hypothetical protein
MRYSITGDFFHSKVNWDTYHKSGWVDGESDWQSREEIQDFLDKMKEVWLKVKMMKEI